MHIIISSFDDLTWMVVFNVLDDYIVVMKAASDRTRVRILKMLQGGEICVCQVMAVLSMSSSTVSKHLSILKMAGLVRDRRDGRWVYYCLETRERNAYALSVLQQLREWLEDDPEIHDDRKKLSVVCAMPVEDICAQNLVIDLEKTEEPK